MGKRASKKEAEEAKRTKIDYGLTPPKTITNKLHDKYMELYKDEYAEMTSRLVAAGFSEKDLAYTFGVPENCIKSWKRHIPQFKIALTDGKRREKCKLVAKALLAAVGYDYESSKTRIQKDPDGTILKIEETKFRNHQPPNHQLLMFLLTNLSYQLKDGPEEKWQGRQKVELEDNKKVSVKIDGKLASDEIRDLAGRLLTEARSGKAASIMTTAQTLEALTEDD